MTAVRRARPADLDALASLERAVFDNDAWSPRLLEQELDAAGHGRLLVVAVNGSQVVGYAALSCNEDTADLLRVAVHPDHRRQGVARRLCDETFAFLGPAGHRILLEVAVDNSAAVALYEQLGFTEIDRRRRYYAGDVDAAVMQREPAARGSAMERKVSARSGENSCPVEGRCAPARRDGDQTDEGDRS
jgi:ribosomal-protein-alanine N-acetyltransferase